MSKWMAHNVYDGIKFDTRLIERFCALVYISNLYWRHWFSVEGTQGMRKNLEDEVFM
jgi:hypothetical protein